jgi:hypothetical protein
MRLDARAIRTRGDRSTRAEEARVPRAVSMDSFADRLADVGITRLGLSAPLSCRSRSYAMPRRGTTSAKPYC